MLEQLQALVLALTMLHTTLAAQVPTTNTLINEVVEVSYEAQVKEVDPRIEKLIACESGHRWSIKIVDTNGYYSYGGFQFQLGTFKAYGEKYGILPKGTTNDEARLLIFREDLQRAIATQMLKDGETYHWSNCWKKINKT